MLAINFSLLVPLVGRSELFEMTFQECGGLGYDEKARPKKWVHVG
jgi:hypothetical protein